MDTELEINRQLIDSEATIKSGLRKLEEERVTINYYDSIVY